MPDNDGWWGFADGVGHGLVERATLRGCVSGCFQFVVGLVLIVVLLVVAGAVLVAIF